MALSEQGSGHRHINQRGISLEKRNAGVFDPPIVLPQIRSQHIEIPGPVYYGDAEDAGFPSTTGIDCNIPASFFDDLNLPSQPQPVEPRVEYFDAACDGGGDDEESSDDSDPDDEPYEDEPLPSPPPTRPRARGKARGETGRFTASQAGTSTVSGARSSRDRSWVVTGVVPGGPEYGDVIPSFLGHVAHLIWSGEMRGTLKCQNRSTMRPLIEQWRTALGPDTRSRVDSSGLAQLPGSMYDHLDHALLSAFVERWQPDTSSFHLPFGEMTVMLHDVWEILRVPIEGKQVVENGSPSELRRLVGALSGLTMNQMGKDMIDGGGVVTDNFMRLCKQQPEHIQVQGMYFCILGTCLFPDKSGSRMRLRDIAEAVDPEHISEYSWGSATLAYLYRNLGIASRVDCKQLTGCLTLLQAWIYEYFPCFRPHADRNVVAAELPRSLCWTVPGRLDRSDQRLQSIRARIDQLTAQEVEWLPYGRDVVENVPRTCYFGTIRHRDIIEPYMPDRVVRQLGYVQPIPWLPMLIPEDAMRPAISSSYLVDFAEQQNVFTWQVFPRMAISADLARCDPDDGSGNSTDEYMPWFLSHSHPVLLQHSPHPSQRMSGPGQLLTYSQVRKNLGDVMKRLDPYRQQWATDQVFQDVYDDFGETLAQFDRLLRGD